MKKLRNIMGVVILGVICMCVILGIFGKSDKTDIPPPETIAVELLHEVEPTAVPPTATPEIIVEIVVIEITSTTEPTATIVPTIVVMPTSTYEPTPTTDVIVLGWLCDWDKRGEVALWSKPALAFQDGNEIMAVVAMPVGGCIRVELVQEVMENYIDFCEVSFDDNVPLGWVDVDYCYPDRYGGKPSWATE